MSIIPPNTPAEGWDAFNARKQKEREEGNHVETHDENQPESRNLTREEIQIFENARQAVDTIRKTFETWMVIARGVEAARKRADRIGGKQVFERILEQQGLHAVLGKTPGSIQSTAVRLLKILENLPEIEAWRASLTSWERIQWSSPTAVYKHFPGFQRQAELDGAKKEKVCKPSPADRIKELEAENAHLQEENARHDDGPPPFDLRKDSAQDIAAKITRMVNADKAEGIAKAIIGEKPDKPGKSTSTKANSGLARLLDAWNDADITPEERQEFLNVIQRKQAEAPAPAETAPAPEPAPKAPAKPNMVERKRAVIARANAAGDYELAEQIENNETSITKAEKEMDRRDAEELAKQEAA